MELKFPRLAQRMFTREYCTRDHFTNSLKILMWSRSRRRPWTQLYDEGDRLGNHIFIPRNWEPYEPFISEAAQRLPPPAFGPWQNYLNQPPYEPRTPPPGAQYYRRPAVIHADPGLENLSGAAEALDYERVFTSGPQGLPHGHASPLVAREAHNPFHHHTDHDGFDLRTPV